MHAVDNILHPRTYAPWMEKNSRLAAKKQQQRRLYGVIEHFFETNPNSEY